MKVEILNLNVRGKTELVTIYVMKGEYMKKRLSFGVAAFLFALSVCIYFGLFIWVTDYFHLPEWTLVFMWIGFFLFGYELPSRLGPTSFETPLSTFLKFERKDKLIISISFIFAGVVLVSVGYSSKTLSFILTILCIALIFAVAFGPILLLGSPEAKKSVLRGLRLTRFNDPNK